MKRAIFLLLAILLALPPTAMGEGTDMAADAFIERAGIEADESLRERIETFLRERYISGPVLAMMDDDRVKKYARYLSEDLPIDYEWLLEAESTPMPEGANILQFAVIVPQGAAMESLLADFERGLLYYDPAWPVPEDVCRARYAGALSYSEGAALLGLLEGLPMESQAGAIPGAELSAIRVAVAWEGGVTRCMAGGEGVSEDFLNGAEALLEVGRAAARGDE